MSAVAEPTVEVHAEAPMTPVGDVYAAALAKEQGKEAEKPAEAVTPEKVVPEPETKVEITPVPPTSALEAALAEPVTEAKPDTIEDFPEQLPNEGRKDHWARAKARIEKDAAALQEYHSKEQKWQKEMEQLRANPEWKAEQATLKAENDSLRDAITAANVELLPEFRAKYIDGAKALVAKAADKVKAYGGNPDSLREALGMPEGLRRDAAIEEALGENVNDMARSKVNAIISQFDDLNEAAQSERANAQQSYERLTQKQQEQLVAQQQQSAERQTQTFAAVTKKLQADVPTLRLVDPAIVGGEEWNTGVKTAFEDAQKLFTADATPEQTVETAIKGRDYDRVVGLLQTAWKENAALKQESAETASAQPDVRGGKAPVKDAREAELEKTPGQIFLETMAKQQSREDD